MPILWPNKLKCLSLQLQLILDDFSPEQAAAFLVLLRAKVCASAAIWPPQPGMYFIVFVPITNTRAYAVTHAHIDTLAHNMHPAQTCAHTHSQANKP